jgi:T5SS/PEP-CTERM-associated repeat protein
MPGTTFTWTATTASAWTTPSNWSPIGTPAAGDTALDLAGSILVNTGTVAAADLSIGGSLTAPLPGKGTVSVATSGEILVSDALAVWSGSTLSVDAASSVDVGTSGLVVPGNVVIDNGHSLVGDGLIAASVDNMGTIDVLGTVASNVFSPGTLEITGSVTGNGAIDLGASSVLKLDSTVALTQSINFAAGGAELILEAPGGSFGGPITNLSVGDKIEFNFGPGVTITNASVTSPGTVTVLTSAGGTYTLSNVSFAPSVAQTFFWFTDSSTGLPAIQVGSPGFGWTGKVSTDLGVAGNWQDFFTGQDPATVPPSSADNIGFNALSGTVNTLTGSVSAISFNFFGSGSWLLSGATLNVAGSPSPPFLPFAGNFSTAVTFNASTLTASGTTNFNAGATITATSGSQIKTEGDTIGGVTGQSGTLTVTGANTTWTEQGGSPVNGSTPGFLAVGNGGSGVLNVNGGASVDPGGDFIVGNVAGGSGSVTIGAGGTISVGGTFSAVGDNAGSNGSLMINAGGTLDFTLPAQSSSIVLSIGRAAAASPQAQAVGSVTVTGVGALLNTNDNPLDVAKSGLGSLTVAQGGSVAAGTPDSNLIYGLSVAYSGGTGSVTVTDPGSTFTLTGFGFVGRGGTGTLTVENSGSFVVDDAPANGGSFSVGVGRAAGPTAPTNIGGTGTALVTGNGVLEINSSIGGIGVGGNGASGVLNVNNNGTVLAGNGMTIGTATSAGGTIYGGTGTLDIGANGLVRASNPTLTGYAIVVGGANSSIGGPTNADSGAVLVSGTNALLDGNGGGLAVGFLSPGSLVISLGGKVVSGTPDNATFSAVGVGREANGSITITDPGSSETANGQFYVGRVAAGTLTVENHGSLSVGVDGLGNGGLNIGGAGLASGSTLIAGGSGTGFVTTSGDVFSQQNVTVGENGTDGALTINGGGTVEAGRALLLGNSITLVAGDTIISPSGTTTVTAPTVASANGTITVGAGGLLKVDGTGVVAGQPSIIVGNGTGSTGTLTVSGAGATVDSAGDLSAGQNPGGTGDVTTSVGGQVDVRGNLIVWQGSTVSVVDNTSGIDVGTSLALQSGDILVETGHALYGDGLISAAIQNNGTVIATNNGTFSASTGGKLELTDAISGTGTAELAPSSTLTLDNKLGTGQTVVFDTGTPETLILNLPGTDLTNPLNNVATGDRIELGNGISITAVNMLNTNTAEVLFTGGTYDITNVNFAAGTDNFTFGHDSVTGNDFIQAICFVAGTAIATPDGDALVERLSVGDRVLTHSGAVRDIIWIGTGRVLASRGRRNEATPVIIRKGALAENVPNRDLHVTKGHSVYLDGVLIPVEFLVNHRTIVWDDRAQEVTIYHIELASHDVLVANGAPAESYRDDGNRWLFQNNNPGWTLPPQPPCAPIVTGGPIVDDIWRRLLERAGPRRGAPLTDDPDLHLLVDGKRIDPIERTSDRCVFRLSGAPRCVRIRSRTAVPQELGIARDARLLGVSIRRIVLAQAKRQRAVEADAASLVDGWHPFEGDDRIRWTDGDASVPANLFAAMSGNGMLILQTGAATQYIDDGEAAAA